MTCVDGAPTPSDIDIRTCRVLLVDTPPEQPAKRVLHELDGADEPVGPELLLRTGSALWAAWLGCRPGVVPEVLVGLGTTGIVPTIALSMASGVPYHLTWPIEPGRFLASGRVQGTRVLIVDDQVIHGYTLASFISALRDEAADVVGVLCLVEDATGTGRRRVESTGVTLCTVRTL